MIDLDDIRDEIAKLEHGNTSYSNCEKLSILYSVLDHLTESPKEQGYAYAATPAPVNDMPKSEFVDIASQATVDDLLRIFDDHMEALKILYPKEYNQLLRRIEETL